jgi:hypothetical protein
MVLQCVVDDSGSSSRSKWFVLGGFVAPAESWAKFADEWKAALDKPPGLCYFKSHEATKLDGEFDRKKGWTEELRDQRINELAAIIRKYAVLRVSVSIKHVDFDKYIKSLPTPGRMLASDFPYFMLFTQLMMSVAGLTSVFAAKQTCKFIFDQQEGFDTEIMLWWPWFKNLAAHGTQTDFTKVIDSPPQFENDKAFLPLQAADLYAWQVRNHLELNERLIVPPNRVMQILADISPFNIRFTEIELQNIRQQLEHVAKEMAEKNPNLKFVHADKGERVRAKRRRKKIVGL